MATTKKQLDDANARIAELEAQIDPKALLDVERGHTAHLQSVIDGLQAERDEHRDRAEEAQRHLRDAQGARAAYMEREEQRRELIRDLQDLVGRVANSHAHKIDVQGDADDQARSVKSVWRSHLVPALEGVAAVLRERGASFAEDGFEAVANDIEGAFGYEVPQSRHEYVLAHRAIAEKLAGVVMTVRAVSAGWAATRE